MRCSTRWESVFRSFVPSSKITPATYMLGGFRAHEITASGALPKSIGTHGAVIKQPFREFPS